MFNCIPFSFSCGQAFTCSALFTSAEVFTCLLDFTVDLPFTANEEFLCNTSFTLSLPFSCTQEFLCVHDYDCVYLIPKDWGRYTFCHVYIHGGVKYWAPPSTKYWAGGHVLSFPESEYKVYVEKEATPINIIHGGIIYNADGSVRMRVGGHNLTSANADRTIIILKTPTGTNVLHGGAQLKSGSAKTVKIGTHILALSGSVTKQLVLSRSTAGNIIIHAGAWYYAESVVPVKIGSHIIAITGDSRTLDVVKSASPILILTGGAAFDKTTFVMMYRTAYKDVGLGSGENLNMQLIENNTVYVALYSGGVEITGGSYARASVGFGSIYSTTGEKVDSNTDATFPQATAQWDDIDEVRIFSASTGGTQYIAMSIATFDVPLNYVLQFNSGDIEIEAI